MQLMKYESNKVQKQTLDSKWGRWEPVQAALEEAKFFTSRTENDLTIFFAITRDEIGLHALYIPGGL